MTPALLIKAEQVIAAFKATGKMLATAESCTGGLIAAVLTTVSGSSNVVDRGFVTYSNEAKAEMLGVEPALIKRYGAVSEAVALAMAEGALERSLGVAAVSVTGIAGPGGGSVKKPVGLVHLACAWRGGVPVHRREVFEGDRDSVREQAVDTAFDLLLGGLDQP